MTRTALVVVDPYNEVLAEGGKVWPRLREVVERVGTRENLQELLDTARSVGVPVVYAPHRRWRPGDGDGWQRASRPQAALVEAQLFAEGSFGGQWYPALAPGEGDVVAHEHWGMSGFVNTDLDLQLRLRGIEQVVIAGMTAPGCVEGTARHAMELGYRVTLVTDATAAYSDELMRAAHHLTGPLFAERILPTREVITALTTGVSPASASAR
ncbi:cysteine hydrolase [Nocardia sp. NBC_00565]|uniref:cysteine hydrolase family protein n=1 Tax=Nocardia sp. NBC_00565 TaxID=2975993 RepID=UPI002E805EA4|nr:isochorismatase family cysteine hydrolase [Nocardia sp. NBC_00565]WUC07486.1 cysteine hydrolase [Nocardia sp. NBC_00565]